MKMIFHGLAPILALSMGALLLPSCNVSNESEGATSNVFTNEASPQLVALMDKVDAHLARSPCIGDLRKWRRLYYYEVKTPSERANPPQLYFVFREAGVHGFEPGRSFVPMHEAINADDRPYRVAHGRVDVKTGEAQLEYCGDNVK